MNNDASRELESLLTVGDGYDPTANVTIGLNLMIMGNALHYECMIGFAVRADQVSANAKTLGKSESKLVLRKLLDEISKLLKEQLDLYTGCLLQVISR
ncbi:hypothetical protein IFU33_22820 (plasmid) [Pantoea agglomerans]|uniref:hypothetical protein n=1 Tax=Enterobacter agglomerans TaxID=549 RepID=UPI00178253DC|nr:hypothetical protein [Pantoea agglomerans]WLO87349.1 hypothetical protein NHB29_23125 [Pantoea agglomerans]WVJ49106.1 hypothetical protein IFU33_22820 [Pantoea agglomerans]